MRIAVDIAPIVEQHLKNCGIGSGGFQPGNTCARGGGGGGFEPKFSSLKEAHSYAMKAWAPWIKSRQQHHLKAIEAYKTGDSEGVNELLRHKPDGRTTEEGNRILRLSHALKGAEAPADLVVYRGLRHEMLNQMAVGNVYTDRAYMSASLLEGHVKEFYADPELHADGGTVLRMKVPKGYKAAYFSAFGVKDEAEVVLDRGSSFKVVAHSRDAEGRNIIDVEVLPK